MICLGVLMAATIFFLSLYLQPVLGYSALLAGADDRGDGRRVVRLPRAGAGGRDQDARARRA